ncbi:hypothetical protein [Actinocatenispora rupis]|uniref:Uncharacterized protein n=1 Tax=Actinocatenispora rupis TaxID=519421 RepID=A0A8J3J4M7_9ACTN|nr:hypothetical protein [Actinocatenispora rupis]GID11536.1 hypothetical protein Aru02nite_24250 [Actinocatenispora rupis]
MGLFRRGQRTPQEIGILFHIADLGSLYGQAAYRILFDSLDPRRLAGCSLYDGDTAATIAGSANTCCVAVRATDPTQIEYVRATLADRTDTGLLAPDRRFLTGAATAVEPLVPAGVVDAARRLVVDPEEMVQPGWADGTPWTILTH